MTYDPRKPLTAQDARILTDLANHEAKRAASELWIDQAKELIRLAAMAQQVSLSLQFDPAVQNQDALFQYLAVTCGYTTFVDNVSSPNVFNINWESAHRLDITSPNNVNTNYGYNAN